MSDRQKIIAFLVGVFALVVWTPILVGGLLYFVGEAVEHFTPEQECPPYWKCNGPPETNAAGCECWDKK